MTEELQKENLDETFYSTKYHKDFLSYLGIDLKDFEDEFNIEMDDYAN
jgi:hypothetical protein